MKLKDKTGKDIKKVSSGTQKNKEELSWKYPEDFQSAFPLCLCAFVFIYRLL